MSTSNASFLARAWDSDIAFSYRHSPVAIVASVVAFLLIASAVFAPWVAPHNPFDLASLSLLDASTPPAWQQGGNPKFWLGTDDQG
ncbi:MAG: ABC transporter permease, partial [Betaproteobacteria bacterium]